MRGLFILIAGLALWVGVCAPAMAQLSPDWTECFGGPGISDDQKLAACTRIIDSGRESSENLAKAFLKRGNAYSAKRDFVRAIQDYDQAISAKPDYASAFNNRGIVYYEMHYFNRAIADFDQAIRLNPNLAEAFYNRGLSYSEIGDLARAIKDYDEAIRLRPDYVDAFIGRGLAYSAMGDQFRAIQNYDQVIRLKPDYGEAYAKRGRAYLRLEQIDRAIADLEKGLALDPDLSFLVDYDLAEARAAKAALASRATSATSPKRRIAMIIGNGQYPYIGNLKNAQNDAVKIAAALKARGYEIIGPDGTAAPFTNLTKAQIEAALDAFQEQAKTAEIALIWYSGHGSSFQIADRQKDNFLLPVDFRSNDAKDILVKGVSLERMKRAVIPSSRLRVLIIDACRDNSVEVPTRGIKRGLLAEARNDDTVVMFSTQAGEQADDGDGDLSPFAEGFLEELAANPKDTVLNFLTAVAGRVRVKTEAEQIPEIFTNLTDPKLTLVK